MLNKLAKPGLVGLAALVLAITHFNAWGGDTVYRWKDSAGNTIHSDRPPPAGTEYEAISTRSNFTVEEPSQQASQSKKPAQNGDEQPAATTAAAPMEKDPALCSAARQNLETLGIRGRIRVMGEDGEYRYLDEQEKEIERAKAESVIKAHCE
jgi:hypothetical protein